MLWQKRLAFQNAIICYNPLRNKVNFEREVRQSGRHFSKKKVENSRAEKRKPPSPLISPIHGVWRTARHLSTENHTWAAFIFTVLGSLYGF